MDETDGRTDPELIYWIPKFILMQNDKPFSQLGYMSNKMRTLAESQDKIGWRRNFTEGYMTSHFYNIQRSHLSMSNNFLNGSNWINNSSPRFSKHTLTMDLPQHLLT